MPPRYSNSEEVSTQVWKLREGIYRDRQRGGDEMGRRERERESEKDVWRFSHADKHLGCVMSVYWTCFWTFLHVLLVNIVICSIAPDTKNIINWSWDINMFRYCQFFFSKISLPIYTSNNNVCKFWMFKNFSGCWYCHFKFGYSGWCRMTFYCSLHLLITDELEHIFMCLLTICMPSFLKWLFMLKCLIFFF